MFKNDLRNRLNNNAIPSVFSDEQPVLLYTDPKTSSYEPAYKRQRLDAGKNYVLKTFNT